MINSKWKHVFFPTKLILLTLLFCFSFNNGVLAQKKSKKKKSSTPEVKFSLSTTYDDNILKYSDKYLERFMNNEDQGRFHISSYDDVILNPQLQLNYSFTVFKKKKTKINGDFSHKAYLVNGIKSWSSMNIGIQQYFLKRASFKFFYSYIPEFYVRHFRDRQWVEVFGYTEETFQPFAFSKDNYGFYIQNTFFKNTRVRALFNYAKYFHNQHFTEYDCDNFTYGVKLYQPLNKKLRVEAGYRFSTSDAKGYDSTVDMPATTTGPDASYEEDFFSLALRYSLPKLMKHSQAINLESTFAIRYYSSPHPLELDEEHAGRVDKNFRTYITYTYYLARNMNIAAFYNFYVRDTDTKAEENREYISNEKDYKQNLLGVKFSYTLK